MADQERKSTHLRLPHDLWVFLKKQTVKNECSLNAVITKILLSAKKRIEKKD